MRPYEDGAKSRPDAIYKAGIEARAELVRLIFGFRVSQAIHVAATLGLADLLTSAPKTSVELAAKTGTHPDSLYRLMRALASIGVFREDDKQAFSLTILGEFLRTDVTGSHAALAELVGQQNFWQGWGALLYAVRSGGAAFDYVHGSNVWDYRAKHPEEARVFDRAMASGTERVAEAILEACDFSRFQTVVDVGGGDGMFLAKILAAHPRIHGILFDQTHVVEGTALLDAFQRAKRCRVVGGNFFIGVPEGGDAYLLKWILHDWGDAASIDILRCCRRSMAPSGRLLVVEHVVGPPNSSADGTFMDLNMMVLTGGRERTRDEFSALFAKAGFRLTSVTPTSTSLSVLEGVIEASDSGLPS